MAKHKKMALGRGLGEILGEVKEAYEKSMGEDMGSIVEIEIGKIIPNPYQPRKKFNHENLEDLANSIKEYGLLQPILVYKDEEDYVLIAGERRLRASKILGEKKIRAIIAEIDLERLREVALIENIQREDLNPIDLAHAYQELINVHNLTHEELAHRLQKSRVQITNTLRLLNLSREVQDLVVQEKITQGHAKILVSLDEENQRKIANSIVGQNLSVRDVEAIIKRIKNPKKDQAYRDEFENEDLKELRSVLKSKGVNFSLGEKKLTIHFGKTDEIKNFINLIK